MMIHLSDCSSSSLSRFLVFEQCGGGFITLTLMRWMNLRVICSMCSTRRDNKVVLVNVRPESAWFATIDQMGERGGEKNDSQSAMGQMVWMICVSSRLSAFTVTDSIMQGGSPTTSCLSSLCSICVNPPQKQEAGRRSAAASGSHGRWWQKGCAVSMLHSASSCCSVVVGSSLSSPTQPWPRSSASHKFPSGNLPSTWRMSGLLLSCGPEEPRYALPVGSCLAVVALGTNSGEHVNARCRDVGFWTAPPPWSRKGWFSRKPYQPKDTMTIDWS